MKHASFVVTFTSLSIVACSTTPGAPAKSPPSPVLEAAQMEVPEGIRPTVNLCPDGMVEIDGEYCPSAEETCLYHVDIHGNVIHLEPGETAGCGEYGYPSRCLAPKVHKHFCIDRYEYPNVEGQVPASWMDWKNVKTACEKEGKRLCTQSEWTFSCEGPDMQPYPYGDGYHRDKTACNFDNVLPVDPSRGVDPITKNPLKVIVFQATSPSSPATLLLNSVLVPSGSNSKCVSPFGVYDQIGNVDEEVVNETGKPYQSGLKGGHAFGVRNACRPMTEAHNEDFGWYETGGRCCSDVPSTDE